MKENEEKASTIFAKKKKTQKRALRITFAAFRLLKTKTMIVKSDSGLQRFTVLDASFRSCLLQCFFHPPLRSYSLRPYRDIVRVKCMVDYFNLFQ